MNDPANLKEHQIFKETQSTNEPQILKYDKISNEISNEITNEPKISK